jgi:hypothetical protein
VIVDIDPAIKNRLVLPIQQTAIEVETIFDLRKPVEELSDAEDSEYLQEKIDCANAVTWIGQRCQKQPSTNTAIRFFVKTTSGLRGLRRPRIGKLFAEG